MTSYETIGAMSCNECLEFLNLVNEPWENTMFDPRKVQYRDKVSVVEFDGPFVKSAQMYEVVAVTTEAVFLKSDRDNLVRVVSFDDEDVLLESVEDFEDRSL